MLRSWKLCVVLSVSLLANLWIGAQAQDDEAVDLPEGAAGGEGEEGIMHEEPEEHHGQVPDADGYIEEQVPDDEDDEDGTPEQQSVWVDEHFTAEQLMDIHKKVDADGDKKVSLVELLAFNKLTRQKVIADDAKTEFAETDSNSDGKISLNELLGHHEDTIEGIEMPAKPAEEEAEDAEFKALETAKFKAADGNKDGFLSEEESHGIFYPEAHDGILDVVAAATLKSKDKNGDGELDHDELWDPQEEEASEDNKPDEETLSVQKTDFEKLDLDASGKINLEEFKHFESGHHYTKDAMQNLIDTADKDGDGLLTATELSRAKEGLANHPAVPHLLEWIEHHEL